MSRPIVYDVERIRDGRSLSARRVKAIQHGKPIFFLTASFQTHEEGTFEHQDLSLGPLEVVSPDECPPLWDFFHQLSERVPSAMRDRFEATFGPDSPIELRPATALQSPLDPQVRDPRQAVWLRANGTVELGGAAHRSLLSFASDYGFLETALLPHAVSLWGRPGVNAATIDHSMWFHAKPDELRVDEWLLHRMHAPAAGSSRGLVLGEVLTRDGRLVASTAQQGLMRKVLKRSESL